jgi:endonuclease/exonuclease/phosphatase family metal-dependent hydrolase
MKSTYFRSAKPQRSGAWDTPGVPTLRVATYNISGGVIQDKRFYSKRGTASATSRARKARDRMHDLATFLQDANIQIASLQEVDVCYAGTDTLHQAEHLAQAMAFDMKYLPLFDYHLGSITNVTTGLATLSSTNIRSSHPILLSQRKRPLVQQVKAFILGAKGALHTVHEVEGQKLHVINAHLSHDLDTQKEYELDLLLQYCRNLDPVVLLGDLNTTPTSTRGSDMVEGHYFGSDQCMQRLAKEKRMHADQRLARFSDTGPRITEICTYPSSNPSIKLDYCLGFSSSPSFRLSKEEVLPGSLSNHRACAVMVSW